MTLLLFNLSCLNFQEGTSVEAVNSHVEKSQPYVLAIGGQYSQPRQCFVVVEDNVLACSDLVSAVEKCYKLFQVFDLQYPPQAANIWGFVDSMIFGVKDFQLSSSIRRFRAYYNFNK